MDEPMLFEIVRAPERALAVEQLRRAERGKSLGEERLRMQSRVPAVTQPDGEIDLIALKVR
jgi:hypothetical protein